MSTYEDGFWNSSQQAGPDLYSVDDDTKSLLVTRTMQVSAANWSATARGASGPTVGGTATKLMGESAPRLIGGGIVEWEKLYGAKPASRNEYEDCIFGYQNIYVQYTGPSPPYVILNGSELVTVPISVTSLLAYAYFDGAVNAPDTITLLEAFQVTEAGGTLFFFGTIPGSSDTLIVAENSTLRRWRNSNYYERITRYVPRDGLTAALTP